MMKLNLIGSKEDRQYIMDQNDAGEIDLVDMLEKYGEVVDYMTEPMVANLFKTEGSTAIKSLATRHEDELKEYGYRVITGQELKEYKERDRVAGCNSVKPNARSLRLYPIKAVILIGMMLTESVVAAKLRRDIMNKIFNPKDDLEQRMERMENTVFKFEKMMEQLIEMNKNLITVATRNMEAFKEAPKKAPKTKEIKTPYSVTKIAKLANMSRNDVNPILRDQKIISGNTRTGWVLNKEYEEAGWGITHENGGQYSGSFVFYSEKGKDAILKILSRVNGQEQLDLF